MSEHGSLRLDLRPMALRPWLRFLRPRRQVDDLQTTRHSDQLEQAVDWRRSAHEDQSLAAASRPGVGVDDHVQTAGVHERQIAQIEDHQLRTVLRLIERAFQGRGAGQVELAPHPDPGAVSITLAQGTFECRLHRPGCERARLSG